MLAAAEVLGEGNTAADAFAFTSFEVTFTQQALGVSLEGDSTDAAAGAGLLPTVEHEPDASSDATGKVQKGDQVESVNGVSLVGYSDSYGKAMELLQSMHRPLVMSFRRPRPNNTNQDSPLVIPQSAGSLGDDEKAWINETVDVKLEEGIASKVEKAAVHAIVVHNLEPTSFHQATIYFWLISTTQSWKTKVFLLVSSFVLIALQCWVVGGVISSSGGGLTPCTDQHHCAHGYFCFTGFYLADE